MVWRLRRSLREDADWMAELRGVVMRPDLERLGRFAPDRVRNRFRAGFTPSWTWVIEVDGSSAGCIAVRPADDAHWLEHFYLAPALQGQGLGTSVLRHVLARHDAYVPLRLNVLRGSAAQRLYERHAFTVESQDPIDVFMIRAARGAPPNGSTSDAD